MAEEESSNPLTGSISDARKLASGAASLAGNLATGAISPVPLPMPNGSEKTLGRCVCLGCLLLLLFILLIIGAFMGLFYKGRLAAEPPPQVTEAGISGAVTSGTKSGLLDPNATDSDCAELLRTMSGSQLTRSAIFNYAAKKWDVSAALIAAIAHKETGGSFSPYLTSPAGAQGLMQIMPSTWRGLYDQRDGLPNNPYDPTASAYYGAKYLRQLQDKYGDNLTLIAAAYNAGPGAVDKYGGVPPYAETQDYVKGVMANYQRYRDCLTPDSRPQPLPGGRVGTGSAALERARALGMLDPDNSTKFRQTTKTNCFDHANLYTLYLASDTESEFKEVEGLLTGHVCKGVSTDSLMAKRGYQYLGLSNFIEPQSTSLGGSRPTYQIDLTHDILNQGGFVEWRIAGDGSGQHWVTILNIDASNNVTWFDPADGKVYTKPLNTPGKYGQYLGNASEADHYWGAGWVPIRR